ncbi:MAG: hypothetical protein K2X27_08300, partial [Candidatus Obscuribacterales bacterium]|nr:hypothetical protein [Candidatus Obscuribacterales bacterium]
MFDIASIFWFLVLLGFLSYMYFYVLAAGGSNLKSARRLEKLFGIFSRPPEISGIIARSEFDIPTASIAAQIIRSWFPYEESENLEGAPEPLCGRLSSAINNYTGSAELTLKLFYDPILPFKAGPLPALGHASSAFFVWHLRESSKGCVEVKYEWIGPDIALSDLFSSDYRILHYLIERSEQEFLCRNYKKLEAQAAKPQAAAKTQAKPLRNWWRSYSADGNGSRVYDTWPSPQDYMEAVQNPPLSFKDADLQNSSPVLLSNGLPRVCTGMFASVYEFRNDERSWAVRCFDSKLIDQHERYKAISDFILADDLPYTVDFHYIENGIKCASSWYPILKMDWVEGKTLDHYIGENLHRPDVLESLRSKFQVMMQKLRANGVAHGDLQHGNILVAEEEIYLVDYDGFYVPLLEGR